MFILVAQYNIIFAQIMHHQHALVLVAQAVNDDSIILAFDLFENPFYETRDVFTQLQQLSVMVVDRLGVA